MERRPEARTWNCIGETRDKVVAEYSRRDVSKPIGASEYQLAAAFPETLKGILPSIDELENELSPSALPASRTDL